MKCIHLQDNTWVLTLHGECTGENISECYITADSAFPFSPVPSPSPCCCVEWLASLYLLQSSFPCSQGRSLSLSGQPKVTVERTTAQEILTTQLGIKSLALAACAINLDLVHRSGVWPPVLLCLTSGYLTVTGSVRPVVSTGVHLYGQFILIEAIAVYLGYRGLWYISDSNPCITHMNQCVYFPLKYDVHTNRW